MSQDKRLAGIILQSGGSSSESLTDFQDLKIQNLQERLDYLPLEEFMSDVCPPMFREHRNYAFLLYCLNQVNLVTDLPDSVKCHYPCLLYTSRCV